MSKLEECNFILGFNLDDAGVEDASEKVQDLKTSLSSRYRPDSNLANSTPDITCQHVWLEEYSDDHMLGRMGFSELLLVGFKAFGKHKNVDGDKDYIEYSFPVILLDEQIKGIEHQVKESYGLDDTPEMVYLAPREAGHLF